MTPVEFLNPLKNSKRMNQLLAILFYLHRYEGIQSLNADEWVEALKRARLPAWDKRKVFDTLRSCGPYVDRVANELPQRWQLTKSGHEYVGHIPGLPVLLTTQPATMNTSSLDVVHTPLELASSITASGPAENASNSERFPRVFIASSREGHDVAEAIQQGLDHVAECVIWSQGVFGPTLMNRLEALRIAAQRCDFAVLVLTPDDMLSKRGKEGFAPRDNVILELGFFSGTLGLDRTFMVAGRNDSLEMPSDLAGLDPIYFRRHSDGNLTASVGVVCTALKKAIKQRGSRAA